MGQRQFQAIIEILLVAQRHIHPFVFGTGFVTGLVRHRQRRARSPFFSGIGALTESGQQEQVHNAPVPHRGKIEHGLTELFLAIHLIHQIGLVDDIHQVPSFRHAPEHLANPHPGFPAAAHMNP